MNTSEKIYSGKTKDLYALPNGNILLVFKDDVTGTDGVIDPGANTVIGQVEGKGRKSLAMTDYFFTRIHAAEIPTHHVQVDLKQGTMEVRRAEPLGKDLQGEVALSLFVELVHGAVLSAVTKTIFVIPSNSSTTLLKLR